MTAAQHTPGPWYVVLYNNGYEDRETLQHRDDPLVRPSLCFNTEVGRAQAVADLRNAAIAKAEGSRQRICPACNLPPISDCAFANCKREFAAKAEGSAS